MYNLLKNSINYFKKNYSRNFLILGQVNFYKLGLMKLGSC